MMSDNVMKSNIYIDLASHCIGLDYNKPYKRHGRYFYRPYRNYKDAEQKAPCRAYANLYWKEDTNYDKYDIRRKDF